MIKIKIKREIHLRGSIHVMPCESGRRSRDHRPTSCQTTFFRRFKQLETNLKKVVERSSDSGGRSRDRRLTVKQRFLDVSSNLGIF